MNPSEALEELEQEIRRLKIEFDRFFVGAVAIPPEELRLGVFAEVRRLRRRRLTLAERFRLNGLEARLNSLNELCTRRLREHEQAGGADAARTRAETSLLFEAATPRDAVRGLFAQFYEASGRRAATDLAGFHSFLRREAEKIRARTGCRRVQFRIASADGRVKLKARPIEARGAAAPAAAVEES